MWFAAYAGGIFACRQLSGLYEDAPAEAIVIAFAACLAVFIAAWIFLSREIRIYIIDSYRPCRQRNSVRLQRAGAYAPPADGQGKNSYHANWQDTGSVWIRGNGRLRMGPRRFYRYMIYVLLAAAFYLLGMVSCARAMDMPLYETLETSYHERYAEGSGRIRKISEKDGRLTLYLENVEFTSPDRLAPGQMICLVVEAGSTFREEDSDSTDSAASAGSTGIAASAAAGEGSGSAGSAGSAAAAADAYIDPVTGMDGVADSEENAEILPGKRVEFQGKFTLYDQASNPGEFDYRAYMRSLGICGQVRQLSIRQAKLSGRHALFRTLLYRVRQRIKEALLSVAEPEDAGILLCIISGDRSGLDQETRDLYQEAGIIHLLTVSALHISILCAGLLKLVKKLTGSKQGACLIAGAAAGAFCIMAGEGTSLVRAVICFWMLLGGEWFGKAYDMPTAAATAGFWILQESPLLLFQSGFLMTFSCCLGIGLCLGLMQELFMPDISEKDDMAGISGISGLSGPSVLPEPGQRYEWHARLILSVLSGLYSPGRLALSWGKRGLLAAVLLQLFTLPVLMTSNGNISLISPISNLLTVPLMSLLLLSDMLGILGALVWRPAGIFALAPAHYILRWFDKVCSFSLHWVGGSPDGWQILIWFGFLAVVLAAGYYKLTHQHKRLPYAAGLLLFPVCLLILWRLPGNWLQIRVLDVGQGDGIVMETPQGQVFCIDGGSTTEQNLAEYVCKPYLLHEGIRRIDGWLITHTDYDHYSGMLEILKAGSSLDSENGTASGTVREAETGQKLISIKNVYMPVLFQESDLAREIERYAEVIYISEGDQLALGNLTLTVLHPGQDEQVDDPNDGSAAVLAEYGSFSALFTGDLSARHETEVADALNETDDIQIDVLKCGHHGSRTASSEALLDTIRPQAAVISCGLNNSYGHPHQEVLDRLAERGIGAYRTDLQGCITISVSEDGAWEIQPYLNR